MKMTRLLTCAIGALSLASAASSQETTRTPGTAILSAGAEAAKPAAPVILVSIDGFAARYLSATATPNLWKLAETGAYARSVRPTFPSVTFPNHYSIVTGLHADRHGIVDNAFEDKALGLFKIGDTAAQLDGRWWGQAEPIWITATRHHLTAVASWVGGEALIHGFRAQHWAHYDKAILAETRVQTLLDLLSLQGSQRPDFLTLYFDEVDTQGHRFGPESPEVAAALKRTDAAIGSLLAGIVRLGLTDKVNIVVVSDHGMAAVRENDRVFLKDYADLTKLRVVPEGATAVTLAKIMFREQDQDQIARLSGRHGAMECWKREELPPRFRYGKNDRIAAMLCMADVGWLIEAKDQAQPSSEQRGDHGYDPDAPEMGAIFIANGPSFKRGLVLDRIEIVDIYPVLMDALGLTPLDNDGDPAVANAVLAR
jgi:predicted AlkP superfamily pyrophosphatase or phosphodiesterase